VKRLGGIVFVAFLAIALSGCATGLFGGGGQGKLGDGQIDVLKLLAIAGGIQSGDATPLCEAILSGQAGGADETTKGLLLAACRGLIGQAATGQSSLFAPQAVVESAAPSGEACEELRIAYELTSNACGWRE
jgi:hypothetical protein